MVSQTPWWNLDQRLLSSTNHQNLLAKETMKYKVTITLTIDINEVEHDLIFKREAREHIEYIFSSSNLPPHEVTEIYTNLLDSVAK